MVQEVILDRFFDQFYFRLVRLTGLGRFSKHCPPPPSPTATPLTSHLSHCHSSSSLRPPLWLPLYLLSLPPLSLSLDLLTVALVPLTSPIVTLLSPHLPHYHFSSPLLPYYRLLSTSHPHYHFPFPSAFPPQLSLPLTSPAVTSSLLFSPDISSSSTSHPYRYYLSPTPLHRHSLYTSPPLVLLSFPFTSSTMASPPLFFLAVGSPPLTIPTATPYPS